MESWRRSLLEELELSLNYRNRENSHSPVMLCIAGFGDNSSMFENLLATTLAERYELLPLDLPGCGRESQLHLTSLETLADYVLQHVSAFGVKFILAHSVASIIATLVAEKSNGAIQKIYSLEGNLTPADAYFSGTAAEFDHAEAF